MFVSQLFGAFSFINNNIVAVSDNEKSLENKNTYIMSLDDALANELIKESDYHRAKTLNVDIDTRYDIIANSIRHEYGVTEIRFEGNHHWDILMYQQRLFFDGDYTAFYKELKDRSEAYHSHSYDLLDSINTNNDMWTVRKEVNMPSAFYLSEKIKSILLKTGFGTSMILIAYK